MSKQLPRVLLIDDEELIHRLLKIRLGAEKIELQGAYTSSEGLQMARELQPDVILLDLRIDEEMDGLQVLQHIKGNEGTQRIAVILISGASDTEHRVRALDLGAIDFISKPFEVTELRARLRGAIRLQQTIRMLEQRAQVDGSTGLWNRTYFDQRLRAEIAEARRHERPLSIVMTDIDHFKVLNDTHGHLFGDKVIEQYATILSRGRASDIACRFGGDEFAVILPHTTLVEAKDVAERYRIMLREQVWPGHDALIVTASLGVADLASCGEGGRKSDLLTLADGALLVAKGAERGGRDRVMTCEGMVPGENVGHPDATHRP